VASDIGPAGQTGTPQEHPPGWASGYRCATLLTEPWSQGDSRTDWCTTGGAVILIRRGKAHPALPIACTAATLCATGRLGKVSGLQEYMGTAPTTSSSATTRCGNRLSVWYAKCCPLLQK
jgi:hypothetical protein